MKRYWLCMIIALLVCTPALTHAMMIEHVGPVKGQYDRPNGPSGLGKIIGHPSRVYSNWFNGAESYCFQVAPEQIPKMIQLYSDVAIRDHKLNFVPGPAQRTTFEKKTIDYNMGLAVPGGISLYDARRSPSVSTHEPCMTLYLDPNEDNSCLEDYVLPDNIILNNQTDLGPKTGPATEPDRQLWYGTVHFPDGVPAVDGGHNVWTYTTLWNKEPDIGISLGKLIYDGTFQAPFSEKEMSDLKSGRTWITLTAGSHSTWPSKNDPRLPPDRLSLEKGESAPVTLERPDYYYGRILHGKAGTPASPDDKTQTKISVVFDGSGSVKLDEEGYFCLFMTDADYKELHDGNRPGRIHLPPLKGSSNLRRIGDFSLELLSKKKDAAGEIRVQLPELNSN